MISKSIHFSFFFLKKKNYQRFWFFSYFISETFCRSFTINSFNVQSVLWSSTLIATMLYVLMAFNLQFFSFFGSWYLIRKQFQKRGILLNVYIWEFQVNISEKECCSTSNAETNRSLLNTSQGLNWTTIKFSMIGEHT